MLVFILAASVLYGWAWRRARLPGEPHPPGYGRLALFCGSMLTVFVALISPVDGLARYLLVMHMTQHVLLLDIAPILFILSLTKGLLRPAMRRLNAIERGAGVLATPAFAVVLYVGMMWLWHIPALYDYALAHNTVHAMEHVCFATAGLLYWWHLISPVRSRFRLGRHGSGRLHGGDEVCGGTARRWARVLHGLLLPVVPAPSRVLGAVRPHRPEPRGTADGP